MLEESQIVENWEPIEGKWKLQDDLVRYLGPDSKSGFPGGIVLSDALFRSGSIATEVRFFEKPRQSGGRIIFGYNAVTKEYYSIGVGGYGYAYVLDLFLPDKGWGAVRVEGTDKNFLPNSEFQIEARIQGQRASLKVKGVTVFEHHLPKPLPGEQVGLFAWGPGPIDFKSTTVTRASPKAFVLMQYGDPYDGLYTDVIRPVAEEMGLETYRADDIYKPGIILQDIVRGIVEAEVIIAEITPANPNVFYELGYAHAIGKTTILLAERGQQLPFDTRGYRCIFYDNTIRGKADVENTLREHLSNILRGFEKEPFRSEGLLSITCSTQVPVAPIRRNISGYPERGNEEAHN